MLRIGGPSKDGAPPRIDPLQVLRALFADVSRTSEARSRHLVRVLPLQRTCFAGAEEITACLAPLLAERLGIAAPPCTFMVELRRRNNNTFDKEGMVTRIAGMVAPVHKVDLKDPQVVILIEVNQSLAGLCLIDGGDYRRLDEFNLRRFQDSVRKNKALPSAEGEAGNHEAAEVAGQTD
jgi:tRNA acetyltransferase TAN1